MVKFFAISLLLSGALFASETCVPPTDPDCPTVTFAVDGTDFSGQFSVIPIVAGQEYDISANFNANGFPVVFNAVTTPDPVIDFGLDFDAASEPIVFLEITTPYFGGTSLGAFHDGITDQLSPGTVFSGCLPTPSAVMAGSCPGTFAQEFSINGTVVDQENPGGSKTSSLSGPFPSTGNLTLDVGYSISNGTGNFTSDAGFVPEPATLALMGLGVLVLAAAARRRRRTL